MAIPFHKRINSIETVVNSIRYDNQVFRWFAKFVAHPAIRERLKDSPDDQKHYREIATITVQQNGLFILSAALIATVYLTHRPVGLLLGIPIAMALYQLSARQKNHVAEITASIIQRDSETIKLEAKTLYQVCEYYGNQLSLTSLVSIIARQDDILRRSVIYVCVLTCLIYPVGWNDWAILIAFILVRAVINTPLVFDRLK